jgi:drug/metabolite transporter (DMT)-like permease
LVVTLIWGGGIVAIKVASQGFAPLAASALRTGLASAAYVPLLAALTRGAPRPRRGDLPMFVVLGLFGFFLFNVCYFAGLARSTATHASLIWGANPVVTAAAAAVALRERVGARVLAGAVVSTTGVAVIVLSSTRPATAHGATLLGDLLLVGELLSWIGYALLSRVVMRRFTPLQATGYACLTGFLMLMPAALWEGMTPASLAAAPARAWVAILYSGTASVVLAYILWNRALLRLGATRTALFSNLTPLWGLLLAHLIESETLAPVHGLAALLIIGGVLLATLGREAWRAARS